MRAVCCGPRCRGDARVTPGQRDKPLAGGRFGRRDFGLLLAAFALARLAASYAPNRFQRGGEHQS